jgi:predicted small secreted protein
MTKKLISTLLATAFVAGAFATLAGCNTVQGAGKDIEKGGEKVQQEAVEHKKY